MVRWTRIAALATLWLIPLLIFVSAFSGDWVATWRTFGVPSMTPHFMDLYSIPVAVETMHSGRDPLVANPADPYHRPMNYPRIWLYFFSAARISRANVWIVALIFCGLYLLCISILIMQARHGIDAVVLLVASLSVAPLLAMERGNNEMFVFAIVFLGCFATNKYLKSGALGFAAVLKIYPMAAMMLDTIRRPPKQRLLAILIAGAVIVLFALQWRDLILIRHSTPVNRLTSYGVPSLQREVVFGGVRWVELAPSGWIIALECWVVGALAISYGWKNSWEMSSPGVNPIRVELFAAFGVMYVFTYAVGSNWDYRLILLIPTLPLVLEMARSSSHRAWAIIYAALVVLAENTVGFEQSGGTMIGHLATFALFLMILVLLTGQSKKYLVKNEGLGLVAA